MRYTIGSPTRNNIADTVKGDLGLNELYRYPPRRGPTMEPIRKPVILTLKAAPLSSAGNDSDNRAREADPIILRHPAKREYKMSSAGQSFTKAQDPKIRGIGRRKPTIIFFRPYLSASHPPGI